MDFALGGTLKCDLSENQDTSYIQVAVSFVPMCMLLLP